MKEFIKNEQVLNLVKKAMSTGVITYSEINDELPEDFPSDKVSEMIEEMKKQGIKVVEKREPQEDSAEDEVIDEEFEDFIDEVADPDDIFDPSSIEVVSEDELVTENLFSMASGTDVDEPIKMYLREIGQVPLLSYEEEFEISKKAAEGDQHGLQARWS